MAGYIGTKAVNLSTTGADITGDADVSGALDVGGAFTSQGIDDNATSTAMTLDASGNVGIGTSSPIDYYSDNLVVSAPTENGITIAAQATSNTNYLMFADGTSGDARYRGYIAYLHSTDAFAFGTSGSEAMRIDASGRVTTPYQPSFIAYYATGNTNLSGPSTVIFPNTRINTGSHYSTSNGRFTAPVSGVYQFNYAVRSSTSRAYCRTRLYKNGATYSIMEAGHAFNGSSHYQYSTMMSLAAGDYVDVQLDVGFTINIDSFSQFSGYLVG